MSSTTTTMNNTAMTLLLAQAALEQQAQMGFEASEEMIIMHDFAKRLVGRDVYVFMFNGNNVAGRLLEVTDDALLIADDDGEMVVSLRYVVRLREHPLDKRGNKKKIVL